MRSLRAWVWPTVIRWAITLVRLHVLAEQDASQDAWLTRQIHIRLP